MAVVSLTEYRPSPRFDGKAWTKAKIEGGESVNGPWTAIETVTLSPVDSDPTKPQARNFSTEHATSAQTWVRVVFEDGDGDEQFTSPVSLLPLASAADLTTLANVRAFLQKQGADQGQDEVIQALITQASVALARYTERQFVEESATTKVFEVDQNYESVISFAPYELQSLETLKLDTDTESPVELTPEQFRLWPKPNPDGTYFGVRINPYQTVSSASFRWGTRREMSVKGTWGLPSIPIDIVQWANVTVSLWLKRDVAAFETTMHIDEGYLERPRSLPSAVMGGLELYKRRVGP
jgi:hypothetical protein